MILNCLRKKTHKMFGLVENFIFIGNFFAAFISR